MRSSRLRDFPATSTNTVHAGGADEPQHRHTSAYLALVLDGRYEEASVDGKITAQAGDMVLHPPFHTHRNRFAECGAAVLNITLPPDLAFEIGYCAVRPACFHEFESLARRDPRACAMGAIEEARTGRFDEPLNDWLDDAAKLMREDPAVRAGAIADRHGVVRSTLSREFASRFTFGPARYRAEHRLRAALRSLHGGCGLAQAAIEAGYADQSHFTRDCRSLTGMTPAALRKSIQDRRLPAR